MGYSKYIGLPYISNGRTINGLDCWGLVRLVLMDKLNIEIPSYDTEYKDASDSNQIANTINKFKDDWDKIPVGAEKTGDLVIIRIKGFPSHIGYIVNKGMMLHILEGNTSIIERYNNKLWKNRVYAIYRHRKM